MPEIDKFIKAYNSMLESVKHYTAEKGAKIREKINKAKEKAVALEELTLHEAEELGEYLRRDLHDAGDYLAQTGQDFKDWLRLDVQLIEQKLFELFMDVADQTKLELLNLEHRAAEQSSYRAGQITGIGTLQCKQCGHLVAFHKTASIPSCPQCQSEEFKRVAKDE